MQAIHDRFMAALTFASRRTSAGSVYTRQNRPLLTVPPEILDMIADAADLSDAACLALCSKELYTKLDTNRWRPLRAGQGHDNQRESFLSRIASDNPQLFYCHLCLHLHPVANVGPANAKQATLECMRSYTPLEKWFGGIFDACHGTSDYRLTFPHVKLALDRPRKGPRYGIPLNFLAYTEIATARHDKPSTLVSVEPNIINDEMFLRVQLWAVFAKDEPFETYSFYGPGACLHSGRPFTYDMIECYAGYNGEPSQCQDCKKSYGCEVCGLQFYSDSLVLEDGRVAVIITKWLNLGKGLSPRDADWKKIRGLVSFSRPIKVPSDQAGTSRSVFEAHARVSKETIMHKNAALLSGETFKQKLHKKAAVDVWQSRV